MNQAWPALCGGHGGHRGCSGDTGRCREQKPSRRRDTHWALRAEPPRGPLSYPWGSKDTEEKWLGMQRSRNTGSGIRVGQRLRAGGSEDREDPWGRSGQGSQGTGSRAEGEARRKAEGSPSGVREPKTWPVV